MARKRRNRKVVKSKYTSLEKLSYKYVICSNCNSNKVRVSSDATSGICSVCCQKMVFTPKKVSKKKEDEIQRHRGWHLMMEYVDSEGNVFFKGVEQPKLKGTKEPTKIEPKTRKSKFEREKEKLEKEQKLAEKYKRKQEKINGKPKKRGRPKGSKNKKRT